MPKRVQVTFSDEEWTAIEAAFAVEVEHEWTRKPHWARVIMEAGDAAKVRALVALATARAQGK